jgi:phosphoserine phosphatase RsbU/P
MAETRIAGERLGIMKFKLDSLLEITDAINSNEPIADLLARYDNILRTKLGIGKLLIFKLSDKWECILNKGFPVRLESSIQKKTVRDYLMKTGNWDFNVPLPGLKGVDIIIPVINNDVRIGFVFIGDIEEEGEGMSPVVKHLNFMQTISRIIIVAIENRRLFKESLRQEALKKELELASRMQKMLIPHNNQLPDSQDITLKGFYFPHYEVGGDYYDCIKLSENKTGFCIADVSGKGMPAAMLMSNFQASLRALFTADADLDLLVRKLNSIVVINAEGEKFITLFLARYEHETGILEYINAAHSSPVLYNTKTGEILQIGSSCVGIGMLDEIPKIDRSEIRIKDYSKLVCYTDGLSELKDLNGNDVGTKTIIKHIFNKKPVEKNIEAMIKELGLPEDNPSRFDDVSILAADLRRPKA